METEADPVILLKEIFALAQLLTTIPEQFVPDDEAG
jgi:hypothetical protein